MQRYNSYSNYLKQKFGSKVYKLSLSISDSCPNRDGRCGTGGCIFCSGGSGDFASSFNKSLKEQIADAKKLVEKKNKCGKYIAYFQSFTSTYIEPQKLSEHLDYVCSLPEIVGISIGTRADCLGEDILKVLKETASKKPLTIELGLQTVNNKTAELINRCCPLSEYEVAIKKLKEIGCEVVLHIIFGLPFETREMMLETVEFAAKNKVDGVKLQILHVLKGTELFKMFERGEFETLSKQQYFSLLKDALHILPPEIVIHRLTGDGAKKDLVSPLWTGDKKRVLNDLNSFLEQNDVVQGKKINLGR